MIVVFANMEEQEFDIYTESGKTTVPFVQAGLIKEIARMQDILYVTAASYVKAEQLISLADSYGVKDSGEPLYIHTTKPGCLFLSEINLGFSSPSDFKSVDSLGDQLKQSPLSDLLRQGELEIVSQSKAKRISARYASEANLLTQKHNRETQQRMGGEEDIHRNPSHMIPKGGDLRGDDVIPIDLEKRSFSGGGMGANERGLLPDSF